MVTITKSTKPIKAGDIKRTWHLIDVKDQIVGRAASKIATLLMGKLKTNYVSYLDMGDHIVVINASQAQMTGRKPEQKVYTRYSGYPGGLKKTSYRKMKEEKPEEIIRRAVYGMLPKNKLRDRRMVRLHIYREAKHLFEEKFSHKLSKVT